MTKREIIEETVAFYVGDPSQRGVRGADGDGACLYQTEDGRRCAVGRCFNPGVIHVDPDAPCPLGRIRPTAGGIHFIVGFTEQIPVENNKVHLNVVHPTLEGWLQPKYRGHSVYFWKRLQAFHDLIDNWKPNNQGLTDAGDKYLFLLRAEFQA